MKQTIYDGRTIQFQGFHPSEFIKAHINERISDLQDEAPYGSTIHALISRKNKVFKGIVTIYSSTGRFFAVATGPKITEVSRKLVERIRRQLDRWKTKRFQPDLRMLKRSPPEEEIYETDVGA